MPSRAPGTEVRLLFLSDHLGYEGGRVHGATTYFLSVLPHLHRSGIHLTPCFLRERHEAAEALESSGVNPIFLNRSKWDPRAVVDLVRLIRSERIDIVHAAGMKGILLGRFAARLTDVPVVIHLHDMTPPGRILGPLHRAMSGWTDLCLTVSDAVGGSASSEFGLPPERVETLYNALSRDRFRERSPRDRAQVRQDLGLPEGVPVIGAIGRMVPTKGHSVLLEALPELCQAYPGLRLLVLGEGPTRATCENLARKLGISEAAVFMGHRSDVARVLTAMDVVAVPSLEEGLSYSILEAMATGIPVVASRVGGIPELVRHEETGLLVDPSSPSSLAGAIRRVLDDTDLGSRLSGAALEFVDQFSMDRHIERLLWSYSTVLAETGRGRRAEVHA